MTTDTYIIITNRPLPTGHYQGATARPGVEANGQQNRQLKEELEAAAEGLDIARCRVANFQCQTSLL